MSLVRKRLNWKEDIFKLIIPKNVNLLTDRVKWSYGLSFVQARDLIIAWCTSKYPCAPICIRGGLWQPLTRHVKVSRKSCEVLDIWSEAQICRSNVSPSCELETRKQVLRCQRRDVKRSDPVLSVSNHRIALKKSLMSSRALQFDERVPGCNILYSNVFSEFEAYPGGMLVAAMTA